MELRSPPPPPRQNQRPSQFPQIATMVSAGEWVDSPYVHPSTRPCWGSNPSLPWCFRPPPRAPPSAPATTADATVQPMVLLSTALAEMDVDDVGGEEEEDELTADVDGVVPVSTALPPSSNGVSVVPSISVAPAAAIVSEDPTAHADCLLGSSFADTTDRLDPLSRGGPTVYVFTRQRQTQRGITAPVNFTITPNSVAAPGDTSDKPPQQLRQCTKTGFFRRLRASRRRKLHRRLRVLGQDRRPGEHGRTWQSSELQRRMSSPLYYGPQVFDEMLLRPIPPKLTDKHSSSSSVAFENQFQVLLSCMKSKAWTRGELLQRIARHTMHELVRSLENGKDSSAYDTPPVTLESLSNSSVTNLGDDTTFSNRDSSNGLLASEPYGIPCMVKIFHYLCSLLNYVETIEMGPKSNPLAYDEDVPLFALGLINSAIVLGGPSIKQLPKLFSLIQDELFRNLMQFGLSMSPLILSMGCSIVLNLYHHFRTESKMQLEAFFACVILRLAQSSNVFEDLANLLSKSISPVNCPFSAIKKVLQDRRHRNGGPQVLQLRDHPNVVRLFSYQLIPGWSAELLLGLVSALDTLCGQAYGAQWYPKVGLQLHRAIVPLVLVCLPFSLNWISMGRLFFLIGQDPEILMAAGKFVVWLIHALFGYAVLVPLMTFLRSPSLIMPMLLSTLVTLCIHIPLCWTLVYRSGLGNIGAPMSISFSFWLSVLLKGSYVWCSPSCNRPRVPSSKVVVYGMGDFFKQAYFFGLGLHWRLQAVIGILPCTPFNPFFFFISDSLWWLVKMGMAEELEASLLVLRGFESDFPQEPSENLKKAAKCTTKRCAVILGTMGPELLVVNKSGRCISNGVKAFVTLMLDQHPDASPTLLSRNCDGPVRSVKLGIPIFIGQYLFTRSETTSVWWEVSALISDSVGCVIKVSATLAEHLFILHIYHIHLATFTDADIDFWTPANGPYRIVLRAVSAMFPGGIRMVTPALISRAFMEHDFAKVEMFFIASQSVLCVSSIRLLAVSLPLLRYHDRIQASKKMTQWQGITPAIIIALVVWLGSDTIFEALKGWRGKSQSDGFFFGTYVLLTRLADIPIVALHFFHVQSAKRFLDLVLVQPPIPLSWAFASDFVRAGHQLADDIYNYGSVASILTWPSCYYCDSLSRMLRGGQVSGRLS